MVNRVTHNTRGKQVATRSSPQEENVLLKRSLDNLEGDGCGEGESHGCGTSETGGGLRFVSS